MRREGKEWARGVWGFGGRWYLGGRGLECRPVGRWRRRLVSWWRLFAGDSSTSPWHPSRFLPTRCPRCRSSINGPSDYYGASPVSMRFTASLFSKSNNHDNNESQGRTHAPECELPPPRATMPNNNQTKQRFRAPAVVVPSFPWIHSPALLKQILRHDDYSGMPKNIRGGGYCVKWWGPENWISTFGRYSPVPFWGRCLPASWDLIFREMSAVLINNEDGVLPIDTSRRMLNEFCYQINNPYKFEERR